LLAEHGITQLVDVRHYPRSRRNPPFNAEALARELPLRGVTYVWLGEELGGLREGGYPAWMEREPFQRGRARLEQLAAQQPTTIMCAETLWAGCHRRFIARELAARGYRVTHLTHVGKPGYDEPLSLPLPNATLALPDGEPSRAGGR
jgi:uncharacterized protein (DUF488 family)